MTDAELVLNILSDNKPHGVLEIMQRAKPGCINWALRSRVADLRKQGYNIPKNKIGSDGQAVYQLIPKMIFDDKGQRIIH